MRKMAIIAEDEHVQIDKLRLGPFEASSYVITCRQTGESVLIDAPAEATEILRHLRGTKPRYILITHGHPDHLGALSELRAELGIPTAIHPLDAVSLPSPPQILLHEGDTLYFGGLKLKVLHTPGHTPGSLCFLLGKHLFSGDTLFPGGPGKTRSSADLRQIIESITSKIFILPDDTQIYPGHGEATRLGKEKVEFAIFASRPHDPGLCGDVLWLSS